MTVATFLHRYPIAITESGCWQWRGARTDASTPGPTYGRIWIRVDGQAKQRQAHRVAWEVVNGASPAKAALMNRGCECGTLCVNPVHWRLVDRAAVPKLLAKAGRTSKGWKQRMAVLPARRKQAKKLSMDEARVIRASEAPSDLLAAQFGVSREMIRGIRRGQYWREATPWTV